jgi:purine-binding chemotaxis protein CheW
MAMNSSSGQYLTFELAEETYGIEVTTIREILEVQMITRVPRTAPYLLGVMNVRGRVVPVLDLRQKFGLEKVDLTADSAIIVLEVNEEKTDSLIGLLVDSVDDALEFGAEDIEPAPSMGATVDGQLLNGTETNRGGHTAAGKCRGGINGRTPGDSPFADRSHIKRA